MPRVLLALVVLLAAGAPAPAQPIPDHARTLMWPIGPLGLRDGPELESQFYYNEGWELLAGRGDFDRDGVDDLVWHQTDPAEPLYGTVVIWIMNADGTLRHARIPGRKADLIPRAGFLEQDCDPQSAAFTPAHCQLKWIIRVVQGDRLVWRFNEPED